MIDVATVAAIDVHVHTERTRAGHDPMPAELREAAARYFGTDHPLPTIDDVADYYRERDLAAVVFTVDWESRSGIPPIPNEEIAEGAAANDDARIFVFFLDDYHVRLGNSMAARRPLAEHLLGTRRTAMISGYRRCSHGMNECRYRMKARLWTSAGHVGPGGNGPFGTGGQSAM